MILSQLRQETPGCEHVIHLNNAGASLMPQPVIDAMKAHIDLEAKIGGYESADAMAQEVEGFYTESAKMLNCKPENIAHTVNATDSYARALSAIPFKAGDVLLTSDNDYISNHIAFISLQKRMGIRVVMAGNTPSGEVDLEDFYTKLKKFHPKLVAVTHVPTNSGLVQPVEEIGKLVQPMDTIYLVDACQSLGQIPVDAVAIGCDFLSGTMRKFLRGPRGAGILFVSDKALGSGLEPMFIDMRGAHWTADGEYKAVPSAKRFEDWEFAYSLVLGSKVAIAYMNQMGIEKIEARNSALCEAFRNALTDLPTLRVLDKGDRKASLVSIAFDAHTQAEVLNHLAPYKINTSVSLKEYNIYDMAEKQAEWSLRVSPHYYNTEAEMHTCIAAIRGLAQNN